MKDILTRLSSLFKGDGAGNDRKRPAPRNRDQRLIREHLARRKFAYLGERNILLEEYRAIYFPIPKVASTSLKILFAGQIGVPPPDPAAPSKGAHSRDFPYVKRAQIAEEYADYFKFAVVRNPFARIYSCFRNKIRRGPVNQGNFVDGIPLNFNMKHKGQFRHGMDFDEFLEVVATIPDEKADVHFRSQWTFLVDDKGRMLTDHVARLESLGDDLAFIFNRINMPPTAVPHLLNSKADKDLARQFSARGKELVYQRYAKDLELFGYDFPE